MQLAGSMFGNCPLCGLKGLGYIILSCHERNLALLTGFFKHNVHHRCVTQ